MKVIGKNWPSTRTMQELLSSIETDKILAWGIQYPGAFGGKPKLDGLTQLVKFYEAGVICPEFSNTVSSVYDWIDSGFTVLGRKFNHSQGKNIIFIKDKNSIGRLASKSDYWVKAVTNVTNEWRIHVFNGWYIGQGRKINTLDDTSEIPIRSRKRGWKIDHTIMPPQYIKDAAKRAVSALDYDFGAVDILETSDGSYCVLEVNKAPGLDTYTANRYVKAITRMVEENAAIS